jgi:hypothetical protein
MLRSQQMHHQMSKIEKVGIRSNCTWVALQNLLGLIALTVLMSLFFFACAQDIDQWMNSWFQ